MRRKYVVRNYKARLVKEMPVKSKWRFLMLMFFTLCFFIYAYSILAIAPLVYGNVPGITEVLLEKQLLTPLAIVATLFVLKEKSHEISAFLAFTLLFIFSAYMVYIYSSFYESTGFIEGWEKIAAQIGYFLNQLMFGINFLCMLVSLAAAGFKEGRK
jgi:hypothetical protein